MASCKVPPSGSDGGFKWQYSAEIALDVVMEDSPRPKARFKNNLSVMMAVLCACVCVSQCDFSRWKSNTSLERWEGVKRKKKVRSVTIWVHIWADSVGLGTSLYEEFDERKKRSARVEQAIMELQLRHSLSLKLQDSQRE